MLGEKVKISFFESKHTNLVFERDIIAINMNMKHRTILWKLYNKQADIAHKLEMLIS